jgi:cell division protein FtsW
MEQLLKRTFGDKVIWAVVLLLSAISLVVVYSSTSALAYKKYGGHQYLVLLKHVAFTVIGLLATWLVHRVNYTTFKRVSLIALIISIILLGYTLLFGASINDGSRWIKVPGTGLTIQTSDLAKLCLFVFLAKQLSEIQNQLNDFKTVAKKIFLPVLCVVGLIAPANLSTAIMIGFTCVMLFLIGRVSIKHISILGATVLILFLGLYTVGKVTGTGRAATWEKRITDFLKDDKVGEEQFQVLQAKMAIALGGITGSSSGNSKLKNFIPHGYSDMVVPIIIEEYGLLGAAIVLGLYLLLFYRSILIFKKCPYAFGAFLAIGLSFTLVFQAMLNMAVGVNLLPVTGLTLPLISLGGSSVLFTGITIGLILSVSKFVEANETKPKLEIESNLAIS